MKSDIRYDDEEPIWQHQVERDKLTHHASIPCTDPECDIKLPGHRHYVTPDPLGEALAALKVIVLTPHIFGYLREKDPMALRQAREAIKMLVRHQSQEEWKRDHGIAAGNRPVHDHPEERFDPTRCGACAEEEMARVERAADDAEGK